MKTYFQPVDYAVLRETIPGWEIPKREIFNHELVFIWKGKMNVTIRERNIEAGAGTLIYFRPGVLHSLSTCDQNPASFYGIHFSMPNGELPLDEVSKLSNPQKWRTLLDEIVYFWKRKKFLDDWEAELSLSRFLLEIFRENENSAAPSSRQRIGKVLEWIHQNTDRAPTIAEMCEIAGIRKSLLIQEFELITGQTPIQYSLSLRLETAKELLLERNISVRDTAYQTGFRDEFYFSRMFRRKYGVSPAEFRKNNFI